MASAEKRCLYEVLGLSRDCTADEIRSAYRRLALQRHPDKLVRSGVPEAEATAAFQELVNAYEVLSDPRERGWYDSHRNQILFSSTSAASGSSSFVPDLFSFFSNSVYSGYSDSGRGFYKVYGDLFEKIYANELSFAKKLGLPLRRKLRSSATWRVLMLRQEFLLSLVTAFYNYWLGFVSVLDFYWADQYDAMAGPNRKSRRLMEEENKKLRKKARREYNETVRGLAEFVKKRDKREPEWAKVEEVEDDEAEDVMEEKRKEFYCVVCSKKFKSDKQWRNHEQSKKHKEKVAELREAFSEEDKEFEETEVKAREADENDVGYLSADDEVNELLEQFEGSFGIQGDGSDDGKTESSEADEFADIDNNNGGNGIFAGLGSDDDEASVLEAMLSGHKSRNKSGNQPKAPAKKVQVESDSDELEFMEYNDTKRFTKEQGRQKAEG
ncbi:hypothetical protein DH2020_048192 [Rehmannia glutinosa]|uniref:J domain-containing protein n=1 Tax=Rehmannia glutinosa TaxID=99300 RepID=A0ABR0U7C6_REHGL